MQLLLTHSYIRLKSPQNTKQSYIHRRLHIADYASITLHSSEPHRWRNGYRAHLECGRPWVRAKPLTMKLVFVASPLSTQH
jgi:hypothetical protein